MILLKMFFLKINYMYSAHIKIIVLRMIDCTNKLSEQFQVYNVIVYFVLDHNAELDFYFESSFH
jgi:hypothetical protein